MKETREESALRRRHVGAGFKPLSLVDADDGETRVLVETTATIVGCHECGVKACSKERPKTMVRGLEVAGRPIVVVWRKRRWQCVEAGCAVKTWTDLNLAKVLVGGLGVGVFPLHGGLFGWFQTMWALSQVLVSMSSAVRMRPWSGVRRVTTVASLSWVSRVMWRIWAS